MPPKRPREDETRTYTVLTFAPSVRWFDEHDIPVITVSAPRGIQVLELLKLIQPSEQITCRGLKLTRKIHDDEKTPMTKFHFISDNAGTPELPLYIEVVQDPSRKFRSITHESNSKILNLASFRIHLYYLHRSCQYTTTTRLGNA